MLRLPVVVALLACLAFAGCSKPVSKEEDVVADLGFISRAYGLILSGKHRPPKDLSEINEVLRDLHVMDQNPPADEVLVSSRDGKPYVVIMGADINSAPSSEVLAYEQTGADGKRYVLLMSRDITMMTDEEFNAATFAKGHKPGKG
jgi:hypothetical protein